VLVEQNLEFIRRLSDRVLIIQKGRITGPLVPDDLGDEDLVAEFHDVRTVHRYGGDGHPQQLGGGGALLRHGQADPRR
jgi:ABC-type sulfate/molybdate transport systems ATPase subunit